MLTHAFKTFLFHTDTSNKPSRPTTVRPSSSTTPSPALPTPPSTTVVSSTTTTPFYTTSPPPPQATTLPPATTVSPLLRPSPSFPPTTLPQPRSTTTLRPPSFSTTTTSPPLSTSAVPLQDNATSGDNGDADNYRLHFVAIGLLAIIGFLLRFWEIISTLPSPCSRTRTSSARESAASTEGGSGFYERQHGGVQQHFCTDERLQGQVQHHFGPDDESRCSSRASTRTTFKTSTHLTVNVSSRAAFRQGKQRDFEAGFGTSRENSFRAVSSQSQGSLETEPNSYPITKHWRAAKVFEVDERTSGRHGTGTSEDSRRRCRRRARHLSQSDSSSEDGWAGRNPFEEESRGGDNLLFDGRMRRCRRSYRNDRQQPNVLELEMSPRSKGKRRH